MSSSNPNIVEISSDSSSDSESDGWRSYLPPNYTNLTIRNPNPQAEKVSSDDLPTSSDDDDQQAHPPPLSVLLTREIEKAVSGMSKISVPVTNQPRPKPDKQVMGLPSPKVWKSIKDKGVHKSMPDFKDKGKRKLE